MYVQPKGYIWPGRVINGASALHKIVKLLKTLRVFCCFVLVIQLQVLEHKLCKQECNVPMSKGWTHLSPKDCQEALRAPLTCPPLALWQMRTPKAVRWGTGLSGQ